MARNVEILKQIYEAFGRGEVGSALFHFDLHVVWPEPRTEIWTGSGGRDRAAAVAQELAGAVPEQFETFVVQLEKFIDGIDTVVVAGRSSGRGKRDQAGHSFVHVWELRDGKVTRFGRCNEMAEAMQALHRGEGRHP